MKKYSEEYADRATPKGLRLCASAYYQGYLKALQECHVEELVSALEDSIIGVEWTIENHPFAVSKQDYEKLDEWKQLLSKLEINGE